ncbi:MAG TPA: ATP-dependent zinc metalloprotease FtsH [Thermoanaerobaculia bacterium]|nr:ATP-dependent zinc metalloprotease FtsH [Thermoanaerobaculia bacterium]
MNSTIKTALLWVVIIVLVFLLWNLFLTAKGTTDIVPFSKFIDDVRENRVESVVIRGNEIKGTTRATVPGGKKEFKTLAPPNYPSLYDLLMEKKVDANGTVLKAPVAIDVEEAKDNSFVTALVTWAPVLFLIGLWIFFMRQMQAGGNKALSFGKSKAKLLSGSAKKVTFKDVAGVDEAKVELHEIIEFLREPQKFTKLGGKIPKGVLLMGPPGTGKTLLARAIAGEANVPFFAISGSDFVEMFVGVGASRVRDLFEQGKKNAPCIIFIDEIDAVGRHRGAGLGGGHDEREQTLNQLLVEMDGFESNEGVILVAATNRPDVLDPALLRPGRFDRRVVVDLPDLKGREGILRVHTRTTPLADDVDINVLARSSPGFSGADLANLVNEAALNAARFEKKKVQMIDFEFAKDKVLMGVERKSMVMSLREKRNTAYHEAGHTIVAAIMPAADPLHKVTIIPRGRALGLTQQLPIEDKYSYSKRYLEANLAVLMGGRIAEEIFLSELTTGAGNDIEKATGLARRMVCEWGMSDMGPLSYGKKEEAIFLGREFAQHQDYSEETARQIDAEVRRIVDRAYKVAHEIINTNKNALDKIARRLLEKETLDGNEVNEILQQETGSDFLKMKELYPTEGPQEMTIGPGGSGADIDVPVAQPEPA